MSHPVPTDHGQAVLPDASHRAAGACVVRPKSIRTILVWANLLGLILCGPLHAALQDIEPLMRAFQSRWKAAKGTDYVWPNHPVTGESPGPRPMGFYGEAQFTVPIPGDGSTVWAKALREMHFQIYGTGDVLANHYSSRDSLEGISGVGSSQVEVRNRINLQSAIGNRATDPIFTQGEWDKALREVVDGINRMNHVFLNPIASAGWDDAVQGVSVGALRGIAVGPSAFPNPEAAMAQARAAEGPAAVGVSHDYAVYQNDDGNWHAWYHDGQWSANDQEYSVYYLAQTSTSIIEVPGVGRTDGLFHRFGRLLLGPGPFFAYPAYTQISTATWGPYGLRPVPRADLLEVVGEAPKVADAPLVDCKTCPEGACEKGSFTAATQSALGTISLGTTRHGHDRASLEMHLYALNAASYSPVHWRLLQQGDYTGIWHPGGGPLVQVFGAEVVADIVVVSPQAHTVKIYDRDPAWVAAGPGQPLVIPGTAVPRAVVTVENPDGTGATTSAIRFTHVQHGRTEVTDFSHDPSADVWTRSYQGGQYIETLARSRHPTDSAIEMETRSLTHGGTLISKTVSHFKAFAWGREPVAEIVDPDGQALTTTWAYFDNPSADGAAYRRLKEVVRPTGAWQRFGYDASGRRTKTISSYLDTPLGAPEAECRVEESLVGAAGGLPAGVVAHITRVQGVETERRYFRTYLAQMVASPTAANVELAASEDEIVCTVPGAAYDAATNLVTRRTYERLGPFAGRLKKVVHANGTLTRLNYSLSPGATTVADSDEITTTVREGAPNTESTDVVDGRETTTVTNTSGQVIAETTTDVQSGLVLSQRLATSVDAQGRPTTQSYLDGSTESFVYGCCGLDSHTDRDGITTAYTREAGVTTESRLGLVTTTTEAGLTRTTTRTGSDATTVTLSSVVSDVAGDSLATTDAAGGVTTISRTTDPGTGHRIHTTTLPGGATRIEEFAKDGQLLKVTGTGVHGTAYAYGADADGSFVLETALDAAGAATSEWSAQWTDLAGRVWKSATSGGGGTTSTFNAQGQLVRQVDADGVSVLYAYDAQGRRTVTAADADGDGVIDYDGADRITRTVSIYALRGTVPVLRTTTTSWTTPGDAAATATVALTESSVDGRQVWTSAEGLTATSTRTPGVAGAWSVTTTQPDLSARVSSYAGGRLVSEALLDSTGLVLQTTSYAYDAHGRLHSLTDARNGVTTYTYGAGDRLASVTSPAPAPGLPPHVTTYSYTPAGQIDVVTLPDHTPAQPKAVDHDYFPTGELQQVSGARTYTTTHTYDHRGRPTSLTTANGTTTWTYFPASGRLQRKSHADATHQEYTWTAAGRPATETNGRGIVTTFSRNSFGQVTGYAFSDATPAVAYTFNRLGQMATATRDGQSRTLAASPTGRLLSESHSGGALHGLHVAVGYDALLRPSTLVVQSGAATLVDQSYTYGEASRLHRAAQGAAAATYAYLPASSLIESVDFSHGGTARHRESRHYDALNRLDRIESLDPANLTAPARVAAVYEYNPAHQRTRATREDGTSWVFGYDALGHLTSGVRQSSTGAPLPGWQFGFAYDGIGNRLTSSEGGDAAGSGAAVTTYSPAPGNRYAAIDTPGVAHVRGLSDPAASVSVNAQPVTRLPGEAFWSFEQPVANASSSVWAAHEIEAVLGTESSSQSARSLVPKASVVPTYDADGNLLHDGGRQFTWDAQNRLTQVETDLAALPAGAPAFRVSFGYDDLGRRIWQKAEGRVAAAWQVVQVRLFMYHGWNVVAEFDAASPATGSPRQLVQSYLWGTDLSGTPQGAGGVGGLLVLTDHRSGGTGSHGYAYDGNGNVLALVSLATGTISARYEYDPFGQPLGSSGPVSRLNPYRFSTKYTDSFTHLAYYGYRFYDPTAGRWLSRDPIGEAGGMNLYGMCDNNAIVNIDVLGLWSPTAHDALIDDALSDVLDHRARDVVKRASRNFDKTTQSPGDSPMHYMRNTRLQSPEKAREELKKFVKLQLDQIMMLRCNCDIVERRWPKELADLEVRILRELGELMHPLMDASSPMHREANGDPKPWNGMFDRSAVGHSPFDNVGNETTKQITDKIRRFNKNLLKLTLHWAMNTDCEKTNTEFAAEIIVNQASRNGASAP